MPIHDRWVLAIEAHKLTEYLLNLNHPEGASKARFVKRHGFSRDDPNALASALVAHATSGWPGAVIQGPYGQKCLIDGALITPIGTRPALRAVWAIADEALSARLITAYPV